MLLTSAGQLFRRNSPASFDQEAKIEEILTLLECVQRRLPTLERHLQSAQVLRVILCALDNTVSNILLLSFLETA